MAFNAASDTSRLQLRLAEEAVIGTTPANGFEFEITGESINNSREFSTSQSIRSDRQVPGATKTGESTGGDINCEVKYTEAYQRLVAAALQGDLSAGVVSNGVSRKAWSAEKDFTDATGDKVFRNQGGEITTWSMEIGTGAILTSTFGFMFRKFVNAGSAAITNAVQPSDNEPMSAVSENTTLKINGVAYSGLTTLSFSLDNGAREQRQVASVSLAGVGMGRSNLTGSITAFWSGDNPLYTAYKNEQPVEIEIGVEDVAGNRIEIVIHKAVLQTSTIVAGSIDADVVQEVGFQGVKGDGPTGKTITVRFIDAA